MKKNSIVFPATGAWMSAILLTLLMGVVTLIIKQTNEPLGRFIDEHFSTKSVGRCQFYLYSHRS